MSTYNLIPIVLELEFSDYKIRSVSKNKHPHKRFTT